MFKLKQHFSIVSLVAILGTAISLSLYYRSEMTAQMVEVEERNNQALTRTLINTIWSDYRDFVGQAGALAPDQLIQHPLSTRLHRELAKITEGSPIVMIKIFDTGGKTIFSTDKAQTGSVKPAEYPGSIVARNGKVISKISPRAEFTRIDGSIIREREILSSYLPIYETPDDRIVGVFEIYSDVTDSLARIKRNQLRVSSVVLIILGLLYGVLYLFVSRADGILRRQQREHRQATEISSRFGRLLDHSSNEIYIFDADSLRFTHVNRGGRDNLGYSADELAAMTPPDIKPGISRAEFIELLQPLRRGDCDQLHFESEHRRKDGSIYPVEVRLQLSPSEDPPVFVAMILDITDKRKSDDTLNYLAYYDNLTGLPNRRLYADRLEQAMREADRYERIVAVLFVDLDQFKKINDSLGHDAGDKLLVQAAERLTGCVRASDTVARWGGDEFSLVLKDIEHVDSVYIVAEKIIDSFAEPFDLGGKRLVVTASIGIILYPIDDMNVESLMKNADAAMYHAKESGRNNFQFYDHAMTARLEERLELENELRQALANQEFSLLYQPQVDIDQGRIVGIEALIRWQHPGHGLITPDRFIPIAEETGLISPIGEWVLREACRQARSFADHGIAPIQVSVNLSARQLNEPNLIETIEDVLDETGLTPTQLELEITESMLITDVDRVIRTLRDLSALGLTISVDDFGTGHSSLAYLKQFPISTLKIDRSFVRDIPHDKDDMSITTAIINMATGLGIKTVAEGVESNEQCDFLHRNGCNLMQGYYFSKPIEFGEIISLLQRDQPQPGPGGLKQAQ